MESEAETPTTAMQISGSDEDERYVLSVIAKRTYLFSEKGTCVLAPEQVPLATDAAFYEDAERLLAVDSDLYPIKVRSDVVVQGNAYNPGEGGQFDVGFRIGKVGRLIRVLGDRSCSRDSTGELRFSEPAPIDKVPLRYDHAYGGEDRVYEKKYGDPSDLLRPFMPNPELLDVCAYNYPRNPCGKGYVLEATGEALDALKLPNLEDPNDLLTPDRLEVRHLGEWPRLPLPQALDWVEYGWFPRIAHFGFAPPFLQAYGTFAEVERGYEQADVFEEAPFEKKLNLRAANGASPGFQLPFLNGDEECELVNMHPSQPTIRFRLPGDRPKIWTDGRNGKFNSTKTVIHTVLIEPEESRVSVVWRGSAPALRPYTVEELKTMPFRVEWR